MHLPFEAYELLDHLPWRVAGPIKNRFPPRVGYFHVFSKEPLIVLIPEDFYDDAANWAPFFAKLKRRRVYFICLVRGPIDAQPSEYPLARVLSGHKVTYPEHRFVFLANNLKQLEMYTQLDVEAVLVNQNALVDERLFDVIEDSSKKYDAIYNARISPIKRHYLASRIERLALITIVDGKTNQEYLSHVVQALPNATWLNFEGKPRVRGYRRFSPAEVSKYLNQASVGLCLSRYEGAMFAAVEYLLCGLCVLATPSFGGREAFFDDEYVEIADDTAEALKRGLDALLARRPAPAHVRQRTLRKIGEHRATLVDLICRIHAREGGHLDPRETQARLFPDQFYKLRPLHHVLSVR